MEVNVHDMIKKHPYGFGCPPHQEGLLVRSSYIDWGVVEKCLSSFRRDINAD